MPAAEPAQLIQAFDEQVTGFHTEAFSLSEDLQWLGRLRDLGATVAVTLHSSRILEVLAREALARAGLSGPRKSSTDGPRLNDMLRQLMEYHSLSLETYRLLDRLRDLGNKARHVLRKVSVADADQGYAIVLRGLQWFFCEFPDGPKLKSLTVPNHPLDSLLPLEAATLLSLLESADLDRRGFLARLGLERRHCPLLVSPVLAAVLIERLLDGTRADEAQIVLRAALERFPDDIRLRQLQGLLWSRAGRLEDACRWLEAIEATDSAADEETQGILAGAYKRRADAEPARREEWLKASHAKYERGWRQSRETNTYLGINAAAIALWLRMPGNAPAIARGIRDLLEARRRRLIQAGGTGKRFLNCWDQLTLAEAHLLLQEWESARQCYREAIDRFPRQAKALEVAREQAVKNLAALGRSDLVGELFPVLNRPPA
jgi:tetratricopeptide (TPR) repeat protein